MESVKQEENKTKINKNKTKTNLQMDPPGLLLNYTYSLNQRFSKTVTTGFCANNFDAVIVMNDVVNGFVKLSALDWYSIFVKLEKINEIIQRFVAMDNSDRIKSNITLSQSLCMQVVREDNSVIKIHVQKNDKGVKHYFTFTYSEYIAFYALSEFIHLVVTYNRSAAPFIQSYFNMYVQKCMEISSFSLDSQHYFTPANYTGFDSINYSRLFYELSFMCGEKIVKSIDEKCIYKQ